MAQRVLGSFAVDVEGLAVVPAFLFFFYVLLLAEFPSQTGF